MKRSPYKWLDPVKLIVNKVIPQSAPEKYSITSIMEIHTTFFTSPVIPKLSFSNNAENDQKTYHKALLSQYSEENFEIIEGYHTPNKVFRRKVDPKQPSILHRDCEQVEVWRIEEKQTDVNIAVRAMRDAYEDPELEHMIFVSNDTDLCGLLKHLNSMGKFTIGVVAPSFGENRRASKDLVTLSDWIRHNLKADELEPSQLPHKIETSVRAEKKLKYSLRKPLGWYGSNINAEKIFDLLFTELKKRNACYKWLEQQPIPQVSTGLPDLLAPAIELLNDDKNAEIVLKHVEAYVAYIRSKKT